MARKPAVKTGKLKRSPEALTVDLLRSHGWTVEKCTWWEPHSGRRKDLFGFADIIAFSNSSIVLVQATDWTNIAHRIQKIQQNPIAKSWLREPLGLRAIWVCGWRHVLRVGAECKTVSIACVGDEFCTMGMCVAKEKK